MLLARCGMWVQEAGAQARRFCAHANSGCAFHSAAVSGAEVIVLTSKMAADDEKQRLLAEYSRKLAEARELEAR